MELSRQIEEMAKIEGYGYDDYTGVVWNTIDHGGQGLEQEPMFDGDTYHTSHDACQRVIDGLSEDDEGINAYFDELHNITGNNPDCMIELKATPAQKIESLLKAKGVWIDD